MDATLPSILGGATPRNIKDLGGGQQSGGGAHREWNFDVQGGRVAGVVGYIGCGKAVGGVIETKDFGGWGERQLTRVLTEKGGGRGIEKGDEGVG
eukprot:764913-Hanusia_phi.AAC.5